jgi:ketosteroid isomerase-like protein
VLRGWTDAWNRGDFAVIVGSFAADAEVIPDPSGPDEGPYVGRAAIMKFFEGLREEWESDEVSLRELFGVGDKVLARWDWRVRGRASGVETEVNVTSISTLSDGQIVWQRYYFDHAEALKAMGLEE